MSHKEVDVVLLIVWLVIQSGVVGTTQLGTPQEHKPLRWNDVNEFTYGHGQIAPRTVVNWNPVWIILEKNLLKKEPEYGVNQGSPSNLEHWRNLSQKMSVEDIVPRQAIPRIKEHSQISISRIIGLTSGHRPWCMEINELSLDRPTVMENYLIYDLVKSPTFNSPYYEAYVCCMPNIRCKAKTIEALEMQLLHEYSKYLAMLLQNEEDYPTREPKMRRDLDGLNGPFIAWLIGQLNNADKNNEQVTQIFSFPIPDPNQLPWVQWPDYMQ